MYYIGRGIKDWEGYDFDEEPLGAEQDDGLLFVFSMRHASQTKRGAERHETGSLSLVLTSVT